MDHVCRWSVFASGAVSCVWLKESRRRLPYLASAIFSLKIRKCKFLRRFQANSPKLLELGTFPIHVGGFFLWLWDEFREIGDNNLKAVRKAGISTFATS